jgi:nitronate monooxygenase
MMLALSHLRSYTQAMKTKLTEHAKVTVPLICGPMFPCSNPELVAAVSEAGGLGMIQPMTLTSVHGLDFRDGLRRIGDLTDKPVGMNVLLEHAFRRYQKRMDEWIDIALEEGIRFFLTALGHPRMVVDQIHAAGGIVYHDVTGLGFARKAADAGIDGLVCVNNRAGGHAGRRTRERLFEEMSSLGLPLICAGGIGSPSDFRAALDLGYDGVQMGTRFIATEECDAHPEYKAALVNATSDQVVMTEKLTGVPVSVLQTPVIDKLGLKATGIERRLLSHPRTKNWMRGWYLGRSLKRLPDGAAGGSPYKHVWQAGKSVDGVESVIPAGQVVRNFAAALEMSP